MPAPILRPSTGAAYSKRRGGLTFSTKKGMKVLLLMGAFLAPHLPPALTFIIPSLLFSHSQDPAADKILLVSTKVAASY